MPGRTVSRRSKSKAGKKNQKVTVDDTPQDVIWAVTNVSVIKSPEQVTSDDPILQRLLDEAEVNLRWEKFYAKEECLIQPQGICFLTRTLYRRLEIVVSYLYALKTRRQREKKSLASVPNPVYVEVGLERKAHAEKKFSSLKPLITSFSPDFTAKNAALEEFQNNDELCHGRFLLRLHIHAGDASRVKAVVETDEEEVELGSNKWLQAETAIVKADSDFLFDLTTRVVIADISVVMLKPVDKPISELLN